VAAASARERLEAAGFSSVSLGYKESAFRLRALRP
jgi:hypothetical protein